MQKLHQNLFYYYGGPHFSEKDIEVQLENNTTKALINVLENCDFAVSKEIINLIIGVPVINGSTKKLHFTLQESTIGRERIASFSKRLVLGISPYGKTEKAKFGKTAKNLPDAWIWGDDFVILLENKTKSELNSSQIERYHQQLDSSSVLSKSWISDIYPVFRKVSIKPELSGKDRFLISEFRRYLEIIELSSFEGFELQDFARLLSEDRDERNYTLHKYELLSNLLCEPLQKRGLEHYAGKTRDWHGFVRKFKKYRCFELAHFSVFEEHGVGVKLHIGSGPDLVKLKRKADDGQLRRLLFALKEKSEKSTRTYEVIVTQTETIGPYKTDWAADYTMYSEWITQERITQLINMMKSSDRMWFTIYHYVRPAEAAKLGREITKRILDVIDDLWDIYEYATKD